MRITKNEIKIFLTFFILAALFIHWTGWYENSAFALTRAIVDEHRFEIDSFANQTSDRAVFNGHYYSDKAPLTSVLGAPSYILSEVIFGNKVNSTMLKIYDNGRTSLYEYKNPGIFLSAAKILYTLSTSTLFSALSLIVFYRILFYFLKDETQKIILTLIFGFASMMFPYAMNVNVQPISIFFLLLSFYLLLKSEKEKMQILLIAFAGISLGLSIIGDYSVGIAAALLMGYAIFAKKSFRLTLVFFFSFLFAITPLLAYNYVLLNDPFTFMQRYEDSAVYPAVTNQLFSSYGFLIPNPGVSYQVLFGVYRGVFFYYPIFFLSFFGFFLMREKYRKEAVLFLLIFIGYVIFNSSRITWQGGNTFGPRYLYHAIPFLIIPIGFTLKNFGKTSFKILFITFLIFSIFTNVISLQLREDILIDPQTLLIQDKYQQITNSFGILPNVLYGYYIPLSLHFGPRSLIIENLAEGHFDIDIRDIPFARNWALPYHSDVNTFWIYPLILLIPFGIWRKEIVSYIKEKGRF